VAVAGALTDLGRRMLSTADEDIYAVTHSRVHVNP
jgi:hypothetical protein